MKNDTEIRLPAEWERTGAVMIAWPHKGTDWADMLPEVTECYIKLIEAISRYSTVVIVTPAIDIVLPHIITSDIDPQKLLWFVVPTNDTWTRDYGPIITT
ncbi:MAG: agmatine deiminase family protein, partial [Muribaculaceae bacterium]|nr:agmatine deiminase family protein [Muribaculaceae bacterium]